MPRPVVAADKLHDFTVAPDKEVGRHLHPAYLRKVRVGIPVEGVGEQSLYFGPAVLTRRQTDGMDHHQIHLSTGWAWSKVGGANMVCERIPTLVPLCVGGQGVPSRFHLLAVCRAAIHTLQAWHGITVWQMHATLGTGHHRLRP